MHHPYGGGAHGGDLPVLPRSLDFYGGATRHPWRCTALRTAVHTGRSGGRLTLPLLYQVQVGTALGVAVPPDKVAVTHQCTPLLASSIGHHHRGGSAPDRAWRCPRGSTPSMTTPPFLHLFHHLCKCANTPSVSPSRASVLAFFTNIFQRLITSHRMCTRPKMQCKYFNT